MLFHAFLYIVYAVLNTAAMAAVKAAMQRLRPNGRSAAVIRFALGAALYAGALAVLLILLKDGQASTVFPIAIGCTVLAANVAGARFYEERLTRQKLAGTLLLTAGIALTFLDGASP